MKNYKKIRKNLQEKKTKEKICDIIPIAVICLRRCFAKAVYTKELYKNKVFRIRRSKYGIGNNHRNVQKSV